MTEDRLSLQSAQQLGPGLRRGGDGGSLDLWLLSKLVCPLTRQPLRYDGIAQELISDAAGLAYPVRDGTPVMLVEQARRL